MTRNIFMQAPLYSRSGYGEHARDIVLALFDSRKYNIAVAPVQWGGTSTVDNFPTDVSDKLTFMVNNRIRNNTPFTYVHIGVPPEFKRVSTLCNIGITAGLESDKITQLWVDHCNQMSAIIVPSTFIKALFERSGVTVPVFAIGEGVDINTFNQVPRIPSIPLEFETDFNFLGGGQYIGNGLEGDRKGIGKLVRLFLETFKENKNVGLVLKTFSINVSSPDFVFTKNRIDAIKKKQPFPKIYIIHGDMTDIEVADLYRHPQIKAFVSTTCGEGWGRMASEAAASNLPILITGWSGHMDFLYPESHLATFFEYELGDVPRTEWSPGLFEPGMKWAFAKDDHVKRMLMRCYEKYDIGKEHAVKLGELFRNNWNKERTNKRLVEAFDQITKPPSEIIGPGIGVQQI